MKKIASLLTTAVFALLLSAPASADSIIHLWHCEVNDGSSMDEVTKLTEDWVKAAKSMEGGEDLRVLLELPIAANAGGNEFVFVLVAPDTKTWGLFMNDYDTSAAAEADAAWNEAATCSSSGMWVSMEIGAE